MNSNHTALNDDSRRQPGIPADRQSGDSLAACGPSGEADAIHAAEKTAIKNPERAARLIAPSAAARNDAGPHDFEPTYVAQPAPDASSMHLGPARPHVARISDDWMESNCEAQPAASANVGAAAASAVAEVAQTVPAPLPAKSKRAYGRSRRAAATPSTRLPLAHEPDMFPAFMSRSALFSAIRANSGEFLAGPVRASGNVSVSVQGPQLSMADKRVWESLVRIAKRGAIDVERPFKVSMPSIAEMAGFGRAQGRSAWAAIERLAATRVDAVVDGVGVSGPLLASAKKDGQRSAVEFDPMFMQAALGRTLNIAMPDAPRGRAQPPLAQWMGDYFQTHEPFAKAPDLRYLSELCGHGGSPKGFVAALEAAMATLQAARPDLIASWSIDKSTRSSLEWTLLVARGASRPQVKRPFKGKAATTAVADLVAAAAAARRRGPAL